MGINKSIIGTRDHFACILSKRQEQKSMSKFIGYNKL